MHAPLIRVCQRTNRVSQGKLLQKSKGFTTFPLGNKGKQSQPNVPECEFWKINDTKAKKISEYSDAVLHEKGQIKKVK